MPEDIRVGKPLGFLTVVDPDEPQNRMTKYSIMQGEYRDTFTIETDPKRNEGIIKPTKVRRPAEPSPFMGYGVCRIRKTCSGITSEPQVIEGKGSGTAQSGPRTRGDCNPQSQPELFQR